VCLEAQRVHDGAMVVEARFARWAVLLALAGCSGGTVALDASTPDVGGGPDLAVCWCRTDVDCGGSAPFCLPDCSACVQCRVDLDCWFACDPATHACVGCSAARPCDPASGAPFCDDKTGWCFQCREDSDCAKVPGLPSCWIEQGDCWPCVPERDVCPRGQYCANVGREGTLYACRDGCKSNADCPPPDAGNLTACVEHKCVQP
jgi:hypothetical protein